MSREGIEKVIVLGWFVKPRVTDGRVRYFFSLMKNLLQIQISNQEILNKLTIKCPKVRLVSERIGDLGTFVLNQAIMVGYVLKILISSIFRKNYVNTIFHLTFPEMIWAILLPGVKIVTFHDLYAYKNFKVKNLCNLLWNLYATVCYLLAKHFCHYYVAVSDQTKRELIERLKLDRRRTVTICPGVNHLGPRQYIAEKKKTIAYIGRCEEKKNPEFLVQIIAELANVDDDWSFYLIGKGCSSLYNVLKEISSKVKVIYKPVVSDLELRKIYRETFCLIHPSLQEGFGFVIIEALLNGCHVIVRESSQIPEIVKQYCIQVSSAKHAARILTRLWKVNRGRACRRIPENFISRLSWYNVSYRFYRLYCYVISLMFEKSK